MVSEPLPKKMGKVSHTFAYIGDVALFCMMCLTVVDVVGRYVFNKPVMGAFEVTEFLMLIIIFAYLGFTQAGKSHITVDILVPRLPKRSQTIIERINHILSFVMIAAIAVMSIGKGLELKHVGEASQLLKVPHYPFAFFLVLGFAVLCYEYLRDIVRLFKKTEERQPK